MEKVGLDWFEGVYAGKRILVTGHTGFKGSWLALWLQLMGAEVYGLSLKADGPQNHWELLKLDVGHIYADICDSEAVAGFIEKIQPHFIFHLAAQSLVLDSYADPLKTWSTNVLGTATVLDACRDVEELQGVIVVTTDKCYDNKGWVWGYRETDTLGGRDPYSASKACTELVVSSFRQSFFEVKNAPLIATARAGNVIGGGDWSENRLVPDLVRSIEAGITLEIRSPEATRPWQHVLDCLGGYLSLGCQLIQGNKSVAESFNFGPDLESNKSVSTILNLFDRYWPSGSWRTVSDAGNTEAQVLHLDSTKARAELNWRPVWSLEKSVQETVNWYRSLTESGCIESRNQIESYMKDSRDQL
ncbi:CDP-glucose 4,6-dehydratase [Alphaproteobacteria bacterium]|nr:CDP-glucose 4,6-dehydratase [Alphaproteobacteria bacterium]